MYCPICGQQQVSDQIRFCSRCGFTLSGVAEVIANNGLIPFKAAMHDLKAESPRRKGVKQGAFLMLLCLLLTPLTALLHEALRLPEVLVAFVAVGTFMGGLLRIFYALMFEPSILASDNNLNSAPQQFAHTSSQLRAPQNFSALPPQAANFNAANSAYVPPAQQQTPMRKPDWREANTNELVMPPSVTEDTTKLLEQEPK